MALIVMKTALYGITCRVEQILAWREQNFLFSMVSGEKQRIRRDSFSEKEDARGNRSGFFYTYRDSVFGACRSSIL